MCNSACIAFGRTWLHEGDVRGRSIIEVGARDINGSLRTVIEEFSPASYVGVDLIPGPAVDVVCHAENLSRHFEPNSFDFLICTEVIEHVRDWRAAIGNFKTLLNPGGHVVLTTRSFGFPQHDYPFDFWRYEMADMEAIFADFEIERLEPDRSMPGVFLKARKPYTYRAKDLSDHKLFSMILQRRVRDINALDLKIFTLREVWRRWQEGQTPEQMRRYWAAPIARFRAMMRSQSGTPEAPFGHVDFPCNGESQTGTMRVGGWALCPDGVVEVAVSLNGRRVVRTGADRPRPDVGASFPAMAGSSRCGWECEIDISSYEEGQYKLLVQALSRNGALGPLASKDIVIHRWNGRRFSYDRAA